MRQSAHHFPDAGNDPSTTPSPKPKDLLQQLLEKTVGSLFPDHAQDCRVILEIPKSRRHGDLTTNIAMRLGSLEKKNPMIVARSILSSLESLLSERKLKSPFKKSEILPPGFINFHLKEEHHRNILSEISDSDRYGASQLGKGMPLQIEFVSANPTGPLSVAHGRQAAVGDSLARILEYAGYQVTREYYVNDMGNQIRLLGTSLSARYRELFGEKTEIPEGGYQGRYLISLAEAIRAEHGERFRTETEESRSLFERVATEKILGVIRENLARFQVFFDHFTHESELHAKGEVQKTLEFLRKSGDLYESEGATWFRSTRLGDDKDRVVIKSDGSFTYLAPDIAYHQKKFSLGFKRLIDIWGPDHHGYIGRLKAAVQALGHPKESLDVLIIQLATLYREGKPVAMSTRMGEFITLQEVMDEVGVEAARFFFVMKKRSAHLDFDLSLAKSQSLENPVYTIQYVHARVANILKFAEGKINLARRTEADVALLKEPEELEILKQLGEFPETLLSCAKTLEPVYLVLYLQKLAGAFHRFYQKHRVITDDVPLSLARVQLALCVQKVIRRGLSLLGITAPDKM